MNRTTVRAAALAAYYMARFNSNLGYDSATQAFDAIASLTGIDASTIKTGMRDSFDYYYPWRAGWDLGEPEKRAGWDRYDLGEVFEAGNKCSQAELEQTLMLLGLWKGY